MAGIAVRSGHYFVARRKAGGSLGGKWEFPGGKCEPGELPEEALVREYREELGLNARPGACLGVSDFLSRGRAFRLNAFLVEFEGEPTFLAEHQETRWVTRDELESLDFAPSDRELFRFLPS
ncbi:MAG TPA: (deoxy)nucleoside triphosphate pyrophosphohydrolase [Magnetospirillaceae bacterium]|nr:(deoxy)nucleoside triphosphate pyrophosphohydrolase [Magnetospirillaceae bacterium]